MTQRLRPCQGRLARARVCGLRVSHARKNAGKKRGWMRPDDEVGAVPHSPGGGSKNWPPTDCTTETAITQSRPKSLPSPVLPSPSVRCEVSNVPANSVQCTVLNIQCLYYVSVGCLLASADGECNSAQGKKLFPGQQQVLRSHRTDDTLNMLIGAIEPPQV